MKRLWQSAKQAVLKTNIYLSFFSVVVTLIGVIGYEKLVNKLIYRIVLVVVIFVISYILALTVCYFCSAVSVPLGNNRIVVIEYGELFSKQGVIVIPFNRFFDTKVDGKVLNEQSVAGQFIKNCFAGNLVELDNQIEISLHNIIFNYCPAKLGKKNAYPIGTVVKVQKEENYYFCVAQTDVDQESKSVCNIEMLHKTIIEILNFINKEANGRDVYMPLLGARFSRLNKEKQIILEYLISTLKAADIPVQSKLHIVLSEADRESINLAKFI